jgi:hypothetical protein
MTDVSFLLQSFVGMSTKHRISTAYHLQNHQPPKLACVDHL